VENGVVFGTDDHHQNGFGLDAEDGRKDDQPVSQYDNASLFWRHLLLAPKQQRVLSCGDSEALMRLATVQNNILTKLASSAKIPRAQEPDSGAFMCFKV